jgi:hypothetical protein
MQVRLNLTKFPFSPIYYKLLLIKLLLTSNTGHKVRLKYGFVKGKNKGY